MAVETIPIEQGYFETANTKLATALATVGVSFLAGDIPPVSNTYDQERPYAAGKPGKVRYRLELRSTAGIKTPELAKAWEDRGADLAMDGCLSDLRTALQDGNVADARQAFGQLERTLPFALVAYFRGFAENRERIMEAWKDAQPFLHFQRGENAFALVSKSLYDRLPPDEKRRLSS